MNSTRTFLALQFLLVGSFAVAWARLSPVEGDRFEALVVGGAPVPDVVIERTEPLVMSPLYDDPEVVGDEDLAAVLERVRPRFPLRQLRPNIAEHALRTWEIDATFDDPECLSGRDLAAVLTDNGRFVIAWAREKRDVEPVPPLLVDSPTGISVRWDRAECGSVHHDHWLACLTEAGAPLDEPVFSPGRRNATLNTVLQEALRDFRLDEREVEWSAMAFGLWLPPGTKEWHTADGRTMNFDRIAERLMRGDQKYGVCTGTHRVYSLMLLWRLDEEFDVLGDETQSRVLAHLAHVRDMLVASQHPEGFWPADWSRGAAALSDPTDEPDYRRIIATGHHLEWLAFAPEELHPPRERILRAADWIIDQVRSEDEATLRARYTFYSHVGSALAAWRGTRPATFWREWRETHPFEAVRGTRP